MTCNFYKSNLNWIFTDVPQTRCLQNRFSNVFCARTTDNSKSRGTDVLPQSSWAEFWLFAEQKCLTGNSTWTDPLEAYVATSSLTTVILLPDRLWTSGQTNPLWSQRRQPISRCRKPVFETRHKPYIPAVRVVRFYLKVNSSKTKQLLSNPQKHIFPMLIHYKGLFSFHGRLCLWNLSPLTPLLNWPSFRESAVDPRGILRCCSTWGLAAAGCWCSLVHQNNLIIQLTVNS